MSETVRQGTYVRSFDNSHARDAIQPRFHVEAVEDPIATAAAGHAKYRDEERVEFLIPGGLNQPVFRVTDEHRNRWPEAYKKFKDGQDWTTNGTPLEMWPILKKSQVYELKAMNVFSIEQVSEMSDVALQRMPMYGHRLRDLARAYLDDADAQAVLTKASHENDQMRSQIVAMERQIEELKGLVTSLHGQQMAHANATPPAMAYVPGDHDPMERMRQFSHVEQAPDAFASLPEPRRRGRPAKDAAAA